MSFIKKSGRLYRRENECTNVPEYFDSRKTFYAKLHLLNILFFKNKWYIGTF